MAKRILEVRFTIRTGNPKETLTAVHEFSLDALERNLHKPVSSRFSFDNVVFIFAGRFWQSVVLMGYFDKERK